MTAKEQEQNQASEQRLKGIPVSDGIACGPARLIFRDSGEYVARYSVGKEDIPQEITRLRRALQLAAEMLDGVIETVEKRISRAHANIFQAQKMIVLDETLLHQAEALIRSKLVNAEAACVEVLDAFEARLLEVDDDYLKDRASDIGEVRRRILEMFRRERGEKESAFPDTQEVPDTPCIVVAEELLPGEAVSFNAMNTAGFLTERGGAASHVAILARGMGIPAISGVKSLFQRIKPGDRLLLNGTTGEIIVNPARPTLNLYPTLGRVGTVRLQTAPPVQGFQVLANINSSADAKLARQMDAEGIGLYRTEFEFIVNDRILTEEEQYERYAEVVKEMEGRPVHLRLADLGGDKAARFLNLPREENPALGYRGARLLLGQPALLAAQARAIARASAHGPIHVIYPMVVDEQQFLRLRALFMSSIMGIPAGEIRHGVMFEVPAACVCAKNILNVADFGSIGSNDLVQYLFAVDRDNGLVSKDYDPDRPAFWNTIGHVTAAAKELGKPVSLCGEMGGQPQYLPKLIAHGIRCVSVSPRLIGLARITAKRGAALFQKEERN